MEVHEMRLHANPFERILNGAQKIEARLNDDKRQLLKVGDKIEFISRETSDKFHTRIVGLIYFPTFEELYNSIPASEFGGRDTEELLSSIYEYYTKEEEVKYGVVGIRLEVIK